MSTELQATVMLCDAAQAQGGKLYVIGAGWTRLRADTPVNLALAVIAHVPWDRANEKIAFEAILRDADGEPVEVGDQAVSGRGELEVGRPAGLKPGEPINYPLVIAFNRLVLPAGGYVWECEMDGEPVARWPFRAG